MKQNWTQYGFARIVGLRTEINLGKPLENAKKIIQDCQHHASEGAAVVFTAELALTGYTCEDLFHSETLLSETEQGLAEILSASIKSTAIWVVGAPLRMPDGRMLNAAFVFFNGEILGVVPKGSLPNMGEFYERRWFVTGRTVNESIQHSVLGKIFVSPHQLFAYGKLRFGIEICHDLWAPHDPSTELALKGAQVILNLSASNEVVGKPTYRRKLIEVQSGKLCCAYVYVSAGISESSKDTVFSGHALAGELGQLIAEVNPFEVVKPFANANSNHKPSQNHLIADVDLERIQQARMKDVCFLEAIENFKADSPFTLVLAGGANQNLPQLPVLNRYVNPAPFLAEIDNFYDVLMIQTQGLLKRLKSAKSKSMVIGISGGLDSTLALRVVQNVKQVLPKIKIVGVTLPGPGTSETTLSIARNLLKEILDPVSDQLIEVSIQDAVRQHLKDLGKASSDRGVVYENAQARERTQILFDLANEHEGIVVGTGDLSELALGWCTYNADHMAHYAVNSGIPKTVVKAGILDWIDVTPSPILKELLKQILDLPISPELLPPDSTGQIAQQTETLIGPYELHDFFIYHYLNFGFTREKIYALAQVAFQEPSELLSRIDFTLDVFYKRFFSQQFKRSTLPPGPKVHKVSLSPRSDFRLPDELDR